MSDRKQNSKKRNFVWKSGIVCMLLFVVCGICLKFGFHKEESYADPASSEVTRGVVDSYNELPSTKRTGSTEAELGTKENPFLILEIVPYEECAELGYLISGCEPVKVEEMFGRSALTKIAASGTAKVDVITDAYFFADEEASKPDYYDSTVDTVIDSMTLKGYYEKVAAGEGRFTQDSTTMQITEAGKGKGDIIWHTIQSYEESAYKKETFVEEGSLDKILTDEGDRIYTQRTSVGGELYHPAEYYTYENNDYFLTDTLGLSEKKAAEYSVVVKTITPDSLTENWIKCADLVYISPTSGMAEYENIWANYNRLGKSATSSSKRVNSFESNDISWSLAKALFMKATDKTDDCAIVMNKNVYDFSTLSNISVKDNVQFKICDWYGKATSNKYTAKGSKNNMYKLAIMLLSMDQNAFRNIYFEKDKESTDKTLIVDGKFKLQSSGSSAESYWTYYTFLPTRVDGDTTNINSYWTSDDIWNNYQICGDGITKDTLWTSGRVHVFSDDILKDYKSNDLSGRYSKFTEFKSFVGKTTATTSDAIRFVLKHDAHSKATSFETLRVLDLEPCVDVKNGYVVNEAFIRWLAPMHAGYITITHQTTAEFNGKIEDLNSTYDFIYMGLDCGAYNLKDGLPDWNDNALDGKIYLHTGDKVYSAEYAVSGLSRSVKWLENAPTTTELRFSGNDITNLKKKDLEGFLKSGCPIVTAKDLYEKNTALIDDSSYVYEFVKNNKDSKDNLCSATQAAMIVKALQNKIKPLFILDETPIAYVGNTNSANKLTCSYITPSADGRAYLHFKFHLQSPIIGEEYGYKLYIDQNRDAKVADDEVVKSGKFIGKGTKDKIEYVTFNHGLSKTFIGLVQWKLEVYRVDNTSLRAEETGFSAIKNTTGTKKKINVLQIIPKPLSGIYDGKLDLKNNYLFTKYYESLDEYEINVTVKTAAEFEAYFKDNNEGKKFSFDKGKDINLESGSLQNPKNYTATLDSKLKDYNMIIIGFGDAYGFVNISNDYGAMDYIEYYIEQGKSILLTHDLTSLHNIPDGSTLPFGYSANTLLRDVMGMNRYGAVNKYLSPDEKESLKNYQDKQKSQKNVEYDKAWKPGNRSSTYSAIHGYTYYAIKRLAWSPNGVSNPNIGSGYKFLMPYRYMIRNFAGDLICGYTGGNSNVLSSGFNNNNDLTQGLTETNKGQITTYPYKIDTSLAKDIAKTHAQWYQLNLEDKEVTVWYCLEDNDGRSPSAWNDSDYEKNQYTGESNAPGTGATYGVSPNDAANNYYIYSKDNIFYSGVGHSTVGTSVSSDMEAKLFINTMIAAYRQAYEAPTVKVTNANAKESEEFANTYNIALPREYDQDTTVGGNTVNQETFDATDVQRISFQIVDYNLGAVIKQCQIYYPYTEGGTEERYYITKIYDEAGNVITADASNKFLGLEKDKTYYLDYPKLYLSKRTEGGKTYESFRTIKFETMNNKIASLGTTTLNITVQALFQLD